MVSNNYMQGEEMGGLKVEILHRFPLESSFPFSSELHAALARRSKATWRTPWGRFAPSASRRRCRPRASEQSY